MFQRSVLRQVQKLLNLMIDRLLIYKYGILRDSKNIDKWHIRFIIIASYL